MFKKLKAWASALKIRVVAVYFAARDKRTPFAARIVAVAVAVYAISPIDLIPDFVPVLGYLDDLIIVPAGLWLAIRMIPRVVFEEAIVRAEGIDRRTLPGRYAGAALILTIWLTALALLLIYGLDVGRAD